MKTINISKKKFDNLEKLQLPNDIMNSESQIYELNYRGQLKLLKKLYMSDGESFANKLYTVQMLDIFKEYLPSSFCPPDSLVSIDGITVGFTVPKLEGLPLTSILNDKKINTQEKIDYLKGIGVILKQLSATRRFTELNSIYINDLHDSNFIVNPKSRDIHVIDLDSCKIGDNQGLPARFLSVKGLFEYCPSKYEISNKKISSGCVIPNSDSDLYCYIIMLLNFLYGENVNKFSPDEFYEYLNYLNYLGITKELIDAFQAILQERENINPLGLLDSLTDEQVARANQKVYKVVKGKIKI